MRVCAVVADVPAIERPFHYTIPEALDASVVVGSVVRIGLHGRRVRGWVRALDVTPEVARERLRPLLGVASVGPPVEVIELCEWAARRFVGSLVPLLRAASPANNVAPSSSGTALAMRPGAPLAGATLDAEGADVVWWPPLHDRRAQVASLLAGDGSSIVVTADPSRADALVAALRVNGWPALAWHSDLVAAARTDAWRRAARGGCVVVGGRTAVFAPVPDLRAGVVVDDLDEALQEERQPTWHARAVLAERCAPAPRRLTILSPLPSVAALHRASRVVTPAPDVMAAGWPRVEVVDLGDEPPGTGLLSGALGQALHAHVERDELAVCLLNRRGRARLLYCAACRGLSRWDREGSPLVDHAGPLVVLGVRPSLCLHCGASKPRLLRAGVDRIGDDVGRLLGRDVRVGVVDATVAAPDAEAHVLVGTEALLHRPEVRRRRPAFVALLDFDQELLAPRLRADEQARWLAARCALLLAGRPRSASRMLIQTHLPSHPVVRAVRDAAIVAAQRDDLVECERRNLPPFVAQALVSGDAPAVDAVCAGIALVLGPAATIKGPSSEGTKRRALIEHGDADVLTAAFADVAVAARLVGRLRIEMDPARA